MKRPLTWLILLLSTAIFTPAQPSQKPASGACVTRVLFLGNSYTYFNDLPAVFSALAGAGHQCNVETRMVTPGGFRLKDHWDKPEAHAALDSQKWDYVVLQDQSTLGMNYFLDGNARVTSDEVFLPYAKKWAAEIIRHGARPVFYLTWARKATPEDQAALNHAYIHAARETGGIVAPVGIAWQQVRRQNPAINLYYKDGSHPSSSGSYLAACVMYAAIFHQSPRDLPSHITGPPVNLDTEKLEPDKTAVLIDLTAPEASTLQNAAWEAWQSSQSNGGYVVSPPKSAPESVFSPGEPISEGNLAGTWSGELLFYPGVGPVEMVLHIQRDGSSWKGHLSIDYPVKDFAAESLDLGDLRVSDREFTFTDPKSAGVANGRIEFRGALTAGDLKGTAEATVSDESGPVHVFGDWNLHLQKK
jgi:uncharacterized protein DUF4886